jgi:hypothetical protein
MADLRGLRAHEADTDAALNVSKLAELQELRGVRASPLGLQPVELDRPMSELKVRPLGTIENQRLGLWV